MEHTIFILTVNNKRYAYTKEMLTKAGFESVPDTLVKYKETSLKQEDYKREDSVLSGVWCSFTTKEEWLDGDDRKVENAITDQAPPFIRHGERWDAMVVQVGCTFWNLQEYDPQWTMTEAGLLCMPLKISQLIKTLVARDLYGDQNDPLSPKPSSTP